MSRRALEDKCRQCRGQILTGLDEDDCAFRAAVDPTPLTALGEALALLARRRTYELRDRRLFRRDRWQIAGRQAGTQYLVLADHSCNSSPLPSIPLPAPEKRKEATHAVAPF